MKWMEMNEMNGNEWDAYELMNECNEWWDESKWESEEKLKKKQKHKERKMERETKKHKEKGKEREKQKDRERCFLPMANPSSVKAAPSLFFLFIFSLAPIWKIQYFLFRFFGSL